MITASIFSDHHHREIPKPSIPSPKTQKLVERLGPIQETIYGGFWETVVKSEDDADNIDSAYSTVALPAHTDGDLPSRIPRRWRPSSLYDEP